MPLFSGRFEEFEDFVLDFQDHVEAGSGLDWQAVLRPANDALLAAALDAALDDDTLMTIRSASEARDSRLLPAGVTWAPGAAGRWQAFGAVYGAPSVLTKSRALAQGLHVSCSEGAHTLCPHCKERCRELLDAAQIRRWGVVVAELARNPRYVNYQPEDRERPSDPSQERARFALAHWAAYHGDLDAVRALAQVPGFRPGILGRKGMAPRDVAARRAVASSSLHHGRVMAAFDALEKAQMQLALAARPPSSRFTSESSEAFAQARASLDPRGAAGARRPPSPDKWADPNVIVDTRRPPPYLWPDDELQNWPLAFSRSTGGARRGLP